VRLLQDDIAAVRNLDALNRAIIYVLEELGLVPPTGSKKPTPNLQLVKPPDPEE